MKNPVGWFEIAVTDLDRAEKFYKALLGLDCTRQDNMSGKDDEEFIMSWFPMEMDAAQAAGTLVKSNHFTPSHDGTLVYFSCDSVDETLKTADSLNAEILLPKMNIGGHGYIAWLEDSEGNRIAIHSMEA